MVEEHVKQETSRSSPLNMTPASSDFLLDLLVYPEDVGDMFLRNIGLLLNYMALRPTHLTSYHLRRLLRTIYLCHAGVYQRLT
jgi:hypothetical protein